jgi:hypothetical protein
MPVRVTIILLAGIIFVDDRKWALVKGLGM